MVECADQICPPWIMDSDFPPHRTDYLRKQSGRDVPEGQTPVVSLWRETRRASHDPASHGDDKRMPVRLEIDQLVVQARNHPQ